MQSITAKIGGDLVIVKALKMPAFVLLPASPSDLEAVARVQFAACASDAGFKVIFPNGPTLTSITHLVQSYEEEMDNDLTCHVLIMKEAMYGEVVSFAIWHFYPATGVDDPIADPSENFSFPKDANKEACEVIMRNSVRKRQHVVATHIGHGRPYACKSKPFAIKEHCNPCSLFHGPCRPRHDTKVSEARCREKVVGVGTGAS